MNIKGNNMHVLMIVGICIIFGVTGQLLMKKGMDAVGEVFIKEIFTPKIFRMVFQKYVFMGILLYAVSSILWMVALSKAELSYIYPLIGAGYIITSILAWVFFGESLTFIRFMGIMMISTGVFLVVIK